MAADGVTVQTMMTSPLFYSLCSSLGLGGLCPGHRTGYGMCPCSPLPVPRWPGVNFLSL